MAAKFVDDLEIIKKTRDVLILKEGEFHMKYLFVAKWKPREKKQKESSKKAEIPVDETKPRSMAQAEALLPCKVNVVRMQSEELQKILRDDVAPSTVAPSTVALGLLSLVQSY